MKLITVLLSSILILPNVLQAAEPDAASALKGCNDAVAQGDHAKAMAYADQLLQKEKTNRSALLCKGRALTGLGQTNEALVALQAAEKQSSTPIEHIIALTLIANAQKEAKIYPEALTTYRQSLAITQAEKDKHFERINLNQIGDVLALSGKQEEAVETYLAANQLSANDNERAESYARIASTYSVLGKHDLAIEHQVKATVLEKRAGDLDQLANANLELGRIYTAAKDYEKAEAAINKTLALSKEYGSEYWEAKSYYYLALTKQAAGQKDAAKPLLQDALRISQKIGAQSLNSEINEATAKSAI